ncbi:hypothetical protein Vadar_030736 [Vaccinium darrowii]|uniref:Uncharacterized protein n=2 Tax=Vaccinium darrowii TaxID=229202 RepID=A0ACB7XW51_9ERIC|nr:hypothetical protein Vadar_009114 [Vaccinium darrowii]KAH7844700.1 hypothetical protein Vadar_030736 [Vaccinium darrowii]
MEDPQFKIGMLFSTPEVFKAAVKQHAIKQQRPVKLVKNDKRRLRAKCMGVMGDNKHCPWEVSAAKVMAESTYQVRTYKSKHKCGSRMKHDQCEGESNDNCRGPLESHLIL